MERDAAVEGDGAEEWTIGSVRIVNVVEHRLTAPLTDFLDGAPHRPLASFPWLAPNYVTADGLARTSIQGFVIDTGAYRVLVDTCIGDMREMPGVVEAMPSDFLGALAGRGYATADIDFVVCTHLHFDHVGWNTQLVDGVRQPTFPNARYLFSRIEWDFWTENRSEVVDLTDGVAPLVQLGLADLVDTDHVICDEVRLMPTPGHSPGHVCVRVDSGQDRAVIIGDLAHHPIQFAQPDVCATADWDAQGSEATRRKFLRDREQDGALVIGTHFADPAGGYIEARSSGWLLTTERSPTASRRGSSRS